MAEQRLWSPEEENADQDHHRSIRVRDDTISIRACSFRDFLQLQQVHLPMGIQMIGLEAFLGCLALREINFPSSIIQIQDEAFKGCASLQEANFVDGLQLLGSEAFEGCVSLTTAVLPSTLAFLGTTVFSHCYRLSSVTFLSDQLEVIPEEAFDNCTSLTHVKLPKSIQVIEQSAFNNCLRLASIELPKGLEEIRERAFSNCCTMVTLELPEGLEELEQFALTSCNSLRNLCLLQPGYFGSSEEGDNNNGDMDDDDDGLSPQNWDRLLEIFPNQSAIQRALYKRFDDLPLHKLCYHQIHYDSEEEIMKVFDSILASNAYSAATRVDALGMTPLHILALSVKPNCELFWTMLEKFPLELVLRRDAWNKTCIDYLDLNKTPKPKPKLMDLAAKLAKTVPFPKQRLELDELLKQDFVSNRIKHRKQLMTIFCHLAICQRKEALCTLELALWKSALSRNNSNDCKPNAKRAKMDRHEARISCGADVVLSNILPFMDEINANKP